MQKQQKQTFPWSKSTSFEDWATDARLAYASSDRSDEFSEKVRQSCLHSAVDTAAAFERQWMVNGPEGLKQLLTMFRFSGPLRNSGTKEEMASLLAGIVHGDRDMAESAITRFNDRMDGESESESEPDSEPESESESDRRDDDQDKDQVVRDRMTRLAQAMGEDEQKWLGRMLELADKAGSKAAARQPFIVSDDGEFVEVAGSKLMRLPDGPHQKAVPTPPPNWRPESWKARGEGGIESDWLDFVIALGMGHVILTGPPGIGKTSIVTFIASAMNVPLFRVNGDPNKGRDAMIGGFEAVSNPNGDGVVTRFAEGPLIKAIRSGGWLLFDEFDHSRAMSQCLHPILEGCSSFFVDELAEWIDVPDTFRCIATGNTDGFGDTTGYHPNNELQDSAFLDRFTCQFNMDWPDEADEIEIVGSASGADDDDVRKIVSIVRASREAGAEMKPVGMRRAIAAALLSAAGMSTAKAVSLGIVAQQPSEERKALVEIIQRIDPQMFS